MTDKTRKEFDQWCKENNAPDGNFMFDDLVKGCMYEAWLAAKEKYEPRWISMDERAPSDRNPVLVYCPETVPRFTACYFEEDQEWIFFGASCETLTYQVTHWMPLPDAPSTQGEE